MPSMSVDVDFTKEPSFKSGGGGLVSTTSDYIRVTQVSLRPITYTES